MESLIIIGTYLIVAYLVMIGMFKIRVLGFKFHIGDFESFTDGEVVGFSIAWPITIPVILLFNIIMAAIISAKKFGETNWK